MTTPMLPPISPIFSRSSVAPVPSSTLQHRGLLRSAAPVLLALVLGVGIAGCDDVSAASSDAASSAAPAESQQDAAGGDSAGSEKSESAPEPQKEFYANCKAAKAAGAAPLYRGDSGYSEDLDRDGDGIACEK